MSYRRYHDWFEIIEVLLGIVFVLAIVVLWWAVVLHFVIKWW